jgi:uncharacterized protein with HEPN domain
MEERELQRLRFIRDSIARIEDYSRGDHDAFLAQSMMQDAVPRRLETLADATRQLSDPLKARHPEIPWWQVYGFRNIAAHAYEDIDLGRVWEIVTTYLPPLKAAVEQELRGS